MSWTYNGETINDITHFPPNTYGFVYKVKHIPSNKTYIGKKILFFTRKVKLGKKELEALGTVIGRKPSYKLAVNNSNVKFYDVRMSQISNDINITKNQEPTEELLSQYQPAREDIPTDNIFCNSNNGRIQNKPLRFNI